MQLLGRRVSSRKAAFWSSRFDQVADRLVTHYGVPKLGNFRDPVKEVFYIILSARTAEIQYRRIHRELFRKYSTLEKLAMAPRCKIVACINDGGLANKRAMQVRNIAGRMLADFGPSPSRALRKMNAEQAFTYLLGLPGAGPKSTLCVMMYSLDFDVFPVDVHVNRICARIGAIPKGLKHYQAQNMLPGLVPDGRSKELHVGLVVHGRRICTPRDPSCTMCFLKDLCRTGKAKRVA